MKLYNSIFTFSLFLFTSMSLATSHDVTYTINDGAVSAGKIDDGAITAGKLSSGGVSTGDVYRFNGTNWVTGGIEALTYVGTWNASSGTAPNLTPVSGEFYIVSVTGTSIDLGDGSGSRNFSLGDWIVYNGTTSRWDKVDNASYIIGFNGRTGNVVPQTNDYNWSQINKTTSSLSDIADVDSPTGDGSDTGKTLKWNNATSRWEVATDSVGGGANSVSSSEIADNSIVNADVNTAAAIDYSKLNIADGDLAIAKTTGLQTAINSKLNLTGGTLTGDLTVPNLITSGNVDGVDLSALAATVATNTSNLSALNSDDVTEASKLYFTDSRARSAAVVNVTTGSETDQAASVAATKSYISANDGSSGNVKLDGSNAMTGDLNMGSQNIIGATNITASGTVTAGSVVVSGAASGNAVESSSSIQIGDDADACNGAKAGTFKYGAALYFCDGVSWKAVQLGTPAANLSWSPSMQTGMDLTGGSSPGSYITFTLTNSGSALSASLVTGLSNTTNFEIGTDNCNGNTLAIGASCTVDVRAKTTADGVLSGNLTVTANNNPNASLSGSASGFCIPASQTYSTPGTYTYTLANSCPSLTVDLRGGGGGGGGGWNHPGSNGGSGGRLQGTLTISSGDTIEVIVAGGGGGGGASYAGGGGGGGATVVRVNGTVVAVAGGGGGGGGGWNGTSGAGGDSGADGIGGSQSNPGLADGSAGAAHGVNLAADAVGGNGGHGCQSESDNNGAGGSGYYAGGGPNGAGTGTSGSGGGGGGAGYQGGGGGGCGSGGSGGAGGSNYILPAATSTTITPNGGGAFGARGANHGDLGSAGGDGSAVISTGF